MHLTVILRITGTLLTLFSFSFLLPTAVALFFAESTHTTFFAAFAITLVSGLILWLPLRGKRELRGGDGFLVTALFYLGLGMFGAIPFWLAESLQLSFTDAVFESISGLTTTGATIITFVILHTIVSQTFGTTVIELITIVKTCATALNPPVP